MNTSILIKKCFNYKNWLRLILKLIIFNLMSSSVESFICDQKCICIPSSGKFTANCSSLDLNYLPQCHQYDPDKQAKLKMIQVLFLNNNDFNRLPAQFFHNACMDNLQKIYLQQVQLYDVDDHAFNPLTNIVELSLSQNHLINIPSKSFENLIRLRSLDLSFNRIREVSNNSFKNLVNLKKLLLNNNNISYIDIDTFAGLHNIQTINLAANHLTILKPESFIQLKNLHSLYLEANDWNCNCQMQPFKRMLLIKSRIQIHDKPKCSSTSVVWSNLALDHFQCAPRILRNYSETQISISEGSTLRLKCAIYIETFGDEMVDREYLSLSQINWYWNNVLITNDSKGCDHNCKNLANMQQNSQHFQIEEVVDEYNISTKLKISNLALYSVMTINEGDYRCSVVNNAGSDELFYQVFVIPYYSTNYYEHKLNPVVSASSDPQISFKKNIIINNNNDENADHVLFGLVLGILSGLFLVLVIFSIMFVFFFRKQKIVPIVVPQELAVIDNTSNTDNNTVDDNHETNTDTTERNASQNEFNPLLIVNPVKKPPRLGIPDVSSIYSNPSFTLQRANMNRSRYASYAETEPLYSDYSTLYRPNRLLTKLDDNPFISDTASEV